jgi:hypothetical protein
MTIVDTDVLIDVQRGHPPAVAWFQNLTDLPAVPGIVLMELIQDSRNTAEVTNARKLVAGLQMVWPEQMDFQIALSTFIALHLSDGLGLLDALIAATAIGRSATLLTFNLKHYRSVPGLLIAAPYIR